MVFWPVGHRRVTFCEAKTNHGTVGTIPCSRRSYARYYYYNETRTHLALDKDAPASRPVQRTGVVRSLAILGGLHHHYARA